MRVCKIRTLSASEITQAVKNLAIQASCILPTDVRNALSQAKKNETSPLAVSILEQLEKNASIAKEHMLPICQDTGMTIIFVEMGQDVHIIDGDFEEAIHEGVRQGYIEGFLRKSMVDDPLFYRKNTQDNTPAIIHTRIVSGNRVRLRLAPKGAGSENKSMVKMLLPNDGVDGVKKLVLETVNLAGPNACPPFIVGLGIGGTIEQASILAKKACVRDLDTKNPNPLYAGLEEELLVLINKTGIGAQGLGGNITALKVHIEYYPTHIATLPVAVNINCHAARHSEIIL